MRNRFVVVRELILILSNLKTRQEKFISSLKLRQLIGMTKCVVISQLYSP